MYPQPDDQGVIKKCDCELCVHVVKLNLKSLNSSKTDVCLTKQSSINSFSS